MDHEFFSHGLDQDEVGWDWLSLQLSDNTELMLYRLRHKDGSVDPFSSGTYVDANGKTTYLGLRDFTMTPVGETYTSSATKAVYPIAWRVAIPSQGLDLNLKTPLGFQELTGANASLSYWEGAITISGTRGGSAMGGVGYLEMTGYAKALDHGAGAIGAERPPVARFVSGHVFRRAVSAPGMQASAPAQSPHRLKPVAISNAIRHY